VVVRPADVRMKFSEFMDMLYSNISASFYLEYTSIKSVMPEMLQDIRYGKFCENSDEKSDLPFADFFVKSTTNVWLGNGKTLGKLHFDPFDNLMAMVSGKFEKSVIDSNRKERIHRL
jgi:jumonji domain-containing protein 7